LTKLRQRKLSPKAYRGILSHLRNWIAGIEPRDTGPTIWGDYDQTRPYTSGDDAAKQSFIGEFVAKAKPKIIWDLGCNTGDYSEVALKAGAERAIGFDSDQAALEKAFVRAKTKQLNLLPLYLDAANPSPDHGWNSTERKSLASRRNADVVFALAFEHHLAIGRNVPLHQVLSWIVSLAPRGIIEFVPKTDSAVRKMLALRNDIFDDYTEERFRTILASQARILNVQALSANGRRLYAFGKE
jgi:ribosomal protein L11 methylase PrmA